MLGVSLNAQALTSPDEHWKKASYISESFREIALYNEYDHTHRQQKLRKWQGPIYYWIDHQVGQQALHRQLVELHFEHLAILTGLSITAASSRKAANFIIVFTQASRFDQAVRKTLGKEPISDAICQAALRVNAQGIVFAGSVIPVDYAREKGKLLACVVEELTQSLGLPNDSDSVFPSIFNDASPNELLSPLDVTLLKLLYNPALKNGAPASETFATINRLAKQLARPESIKKAEEQARFAPLALLLN